MDRFESESHFQVTPHACAFRKPRPATRRLDWYHDRRESRTRKIRDRAGKTRSSPPHRQTSAQAPSPRSHSADHLQAPQLPHIDPQTFLYGLHARGRGLNPGNSGATFCCEPASDCAQLGEFGGLVAVHLTRPPKLQGVLRADLAWRPIPRAKRHFANVIINLCISEGGLRSLVPRTHGCEQNLAANVSETDHPASRSARDQTACLRRTPRRPTSSPGIKTAVRKIMPQICGQNPND